MKLVCISDTHLRNFSIPKGDFLIHAGDLTFDGSLRQVIEGFKKLETSTQGHEFKGKYFLPGNHDWAFYNKDTGKAIAEEYGWKVIDNDLSTLQLEKNLLLFGSAIQPEFCNWAFNEPDHMREQFWERSPACDILTVHSPAYGLLDSLEDGPNVGCKYIRKYIDRVKPKLVICGHIHHSYGQMDYEGIKIVNASICDERYKPSNKPIIIDI